MNKIEFLEKVKDVLDMFKRDEQEMDDALEYIFVLTKNFTEDKFRAYEDKISEFINATVTFSEDRTKQDVHFAIKKVERPDFDK